MESVEGGGILSGEGGAPPRFALPSTGSPPLLFPRLSVGGEAARREFLPYEGPFPDTVRRRLTFAGEKPYCAVFPLYHRTKHEVVYAQGSGCSGSARGRRASGGVVRRNDRECAARYGGYGNGAGRQEVWRRIHRQTSHWFGWYLVIIILGFLIPTQRIVLDLLRATHITIPRRVSRRRWRRSAASATICSFGWASAA